MPKAVLGDVAINYVKYGDWESDQTPLVLVHGLAASSAFWYNLSRLLPPDHPILTYDLRGHGRSKQTPQGYSAPQMAGDLAGLLDSLEIGAVVLAAHSFGGSVALHFTLHQTGRVAALALLDTRLRHFQPLLTPSLWPNWQKRKELFREMGFTMADDEPDAGMRLMTELARLQLRASNDPTAVLPEWMNEFLGQRQSLFSATRWLELVDQTTILAESADESWLDLATLPQIDRLPLLALYGADSPILPSGRRFKEILPGLDLRLIEKAGHFFPASRPEEVAAPLTEFLRLHEYSH